MKPFSINVPQQTLDDLRGRLSSTRWPSQADTADWDLGTNETYLNELVLYWQNDFDWRAQENALNRLAHFQTELDGYTHTTSISAAKAETRFRCC